MKFEDKETSLLFSKIVIHYDKITGDLMPQKEILKKVFQNEIDAWGED